MGKKKKGDKKGESLPKAPPTPQGVSEIAEAVLSFKIHTRELLIEEQGNEAEVIRDKNYHQTERNKKLLEEKDDHLKTLFEQFKEHEAKLRGARKVTHTEVEAALLGKMSYFNSSIQEIKDMGETIEQLDSELAINSEELQRIQHYKDVLMLKNNSRIETIKKEMDRIQQEGAKQEAEVNEKLKDVREDIQKLTEVMGETQQKEILKKLLDSLQPDVKQELKDNVWLKREIGLQKKAFDKLSQENTYLEQRNLKLMDRMYKMKMEDLRAMRKACQPELDTAPQDTTSMPKLSSSNLLWKEVTEKTTKEKLPAAYTSLELRMMGIDGVRAHLATPPDAVKLPPIAAGKTPVAAATRPYWPVTSSMLKTLLTSNESPNSSQTSTLT